jgi:hypothetical protein
MSHKPIYKSKDFAESCARNLRCCGVTARVIEIIAYEVITTNEVIPSTIPKRGRSGNMIFGDMDTAITEIPKVKQSYPKLTGILIHTTPDGKGWVLRYFIPKKESNFKSEWWDW